MEKRKENRTRSRGPLFPHFKGDTGRPRKKNHETAAFSGFVLQQESLDILQCNPIMTFIISILFRKQNKYITQQEYVTFLWIMLYGHNAFPL